MQIRLLEKFNGDFDVKLDDGRVQRPRASDLPGLLRYTASVNEGYIDFNQLQSHFAARAAGLDPLDRQTAKRELEGEIDWLEDAANRHGHPQLFRAAASLSESFSTWFCYTSLGEDKRPSLERALRLLERQAMAAPTDATPLLKAAMIRVGRPQVRDKVEAKRLLERARKYPRLTPEQREEIDRSLQRLETPEVKPVRKPTPTPQLPVNFNYSKYFGSPDERLRCRALCREAKKTKDMAAMQATLEHLYRVAMIAECQEFIIRKFIDDAYCQGMEHLQISTPKLFSLSYSQHGRIKPTLKDKPFLSLNDYKFFELVWGPVTMTLDAADSMGLKDLLKKARGLKNWTLASLAAS